MGTAVFPQTVTHPITHAFSWAFSHAACEASATLDQMSASPQSLSAPAPAMNAPLVSLLLALMLGIQPVTTDLYLPALPALTQGFGAPVAQAQLTLTALLLAFGCSQLAWGPVSDRFGRRPVLLAGLALYTLASLACALAPSMGWLIVWRGLQGAAMGAAVMCARAVVRDLYTAEDGARAMSRALSGLGVIACLSVPLGALLAELLGWRWAVAAPAVFGAGTLAAVALRFEETLARPNPDALRPGALLLTWARILRNPTFGAYSALSTASYAALFTFLASSSFVLIQVLGLSPLQYGVTLSSMGLVYIVGTFMCRWLLLRWGVRRTVALAAGVSLASGLALLALEWAGVRTVWAIMLPFCVFMLAHGVHQPCGQSGAVAPFPQAAGAASALNGFLMMAVAFGVGAWVGRRFDGTAQVLTHGIAFWSVVIAAVAWTAVRRHGELRPAP